MAALNPFLSLNSGNKPWVDQISKTLQTQLAVTIDTPPVSIFTIPSNLKEEKPEAYVPQRIGLGPNHHFQPELYQMMEQNKLTSAKRLLKPHKIHDCQREIVAKVKEIDPIIRACYDLYLDADDDMLAWLLAIDGMFLLDQLDSYLNHNFTIEPNELIMLENQIPCIVLKEIQKSLLGENDQRLGDNLEAKFRCFCKSHSPFLLSKENIEFDHVNHLLDYMYRSIVNNEKWIPIKVDFDNLENDPSEKDAMLELLEAVIKFAMLIPMAQPVIQIIEFVKNTFPIENNTVEEIKVPSVSELTKIAGVKFRLSPVNEGVRNINFVQGTERLCYLPAINLNTNSEVVLRNLVAYEKLMAKNSFTSVYSLELTEYVDFMCGIIDSAKDVKLLREERIIEGDLSDEEIVKLFNGMGKSRAKVSVETDLRKIVVQLNKVYESTPRIWVRKMVEKQLRAYAKIITFIVSISGSLILIREVYFKFYGLNQPHMIVVRFLRAKLSSLPIMFTHPKGPVV
ncbi:putative UPF0481 protein At3g02645 [Rutidosis leptorrhynchoides]|uniref:putative UPF0481 protein At3g02645 n=1 Tax=Rutidosis leptorrhynchoides TaxID=125765 RepID=UPI003A99271C